MLDVECVISTTGTTFIFWNCKFKVFSFLFYYKLHACTYAYVAVF